MKFLGPLFASLSIALLSNTAGSQAAPNPRIEVMSYELSGPLHIVADVQVFDLNQKLSEKGTVERYFSDEEHFATVYNLPSTHARYVMNGVSDYTVSGDTSLPNFGISQALNTMLQPVTHVMASSEANVSYGTQKIGGVDQRCATVSAQTLDASELKTVSQRYCFNAASNALRMVTLTTPGVILLVQSVQEFEKHPVIQDAVLMYYGKPLVRLRLRQLERTAPDRVLSAIRPAEGAIPARESDRGILKESLIPKRKTAVPIDTIHADATDPTADDCAAVVRYTIGEDGRTRDLAVVAATNPQVADRLVNAIANATFNPATLKGKPVAVSRVYSYVHIKHEVSGRPDMSGSTMPRN